MPCPVHTKWVWTTKAIPLVLDVPCWYILTILVGGVAGGEQWHTHRKEIIVEETSNCCVDTELQNQISGPVQLSSDTGDVKQSLTLVDEPKSTQENQKTVSNVIVHHAEDEWEGDTGEQSWVGLLIARDAIGIDDCLPWISEVVGAHVSGWLFLRIGYWMQMSTMFSVASSC